MRIAILRRLGFHACALLVSTAVHPLPASAQSLRCGGDLAGIGDSRVSLSQKCGEPAAKEIVCIPARQEDRFINGLDSRVARIPVIPPCVQKEEWTYHRGPGIFLAIVRFENGVVESVCDGERMR